jgi:hypothetical protein
MRPGIASTPVQAAAWASISATIWAAIR